VTDRHSDMQLGRRAFLRNGTLVLVAAGLPKGNIAAGDSSTLRVGLLTDLHYADKLEAGTRYYRQTLDKLAEAADALIREKPAFVVELGDFIDAADSVALERRYLQAVNRPFSAICGDRHYVLGNHCVDTLTKEEFLAEIEQQRSYYSFDRGGAHFVVLDACFRADGTPYGRKTSHWTDTHIPAAQLEWLQADLQQNDRPVVVFAHQRLDVQNNHGVKNNAAVRKILEASGRVLAVFQGHSHQNDLKLIAGIPYCTLVAMVEGSGVDNNGYSLLEIDPDGTIRVRGFRKQNSYHWEPQR
jgi:predicted phosphodiesterase